MDVVGQKMTTYTSIKAFKRALHLQNSKHGACVPQKIILRLGCCYHRKAKSDVLIWLLLWLMTAF